MEKLVSKEKHNDTVLNAIVSAIEKFPSQTSLIIAIEGGSGSGKSTLADIISRAYDCNVIHMDDFFLRPEQRTEERLAEVGGNIDRERFESEVLISLKNEDTVSYRPFDCSRCELGEPIQLPHKRLTIVEGVYSMHPAFGKYYNFAVFLDIDPDCQRERILKRNSPSLAKRFFEEWIPLENRYFKETDIRQRATHVFAVK